MKLILLFVILFFIISISAIELGISPADLTIEGTINQKICRNLSIKGTYEGILIGKSKWTKNKEINIKEYSSEIKDLSIIEEFPEIININKTKEIEFCVTAKKPGNYYGAIIYVTKEGPIGIGSWINFKVSENKKRSPFLKETFFLIFLTLFLILAFFKYKKAC